MITWTDSKKRTWSINLTLDLADRVLEYTQIDLLPDDGEYRDVMSLCFRRRKLADVLWELSRKQAEAQGIEREPKPEVEGEESDTSFNGALDPDSMAAGWEAIKHAIENFSMGQPALAKMIRQTFDSQMKVAEKGIDLMMETLRSESFDDALRDAVASINADLRKNLKASVKLSTQKALGNSATN